jgi:hypothetical protein
LVIAVDGVVNKLQAKKNRLADFKGIVCQDWEQIQWIPSAKSEECRVAGAYFFPVLMPLSCFNSKNACFGGFSFDSYSANDK